ncbi:MAG: GNAT family N-acetyltransferase, partial [Caulobacter sp.]
MTDIAYRPEGPHDAPLIDALIDRAFGPGRHAKAAERLRENNSLLPDLSFTAWEGGRLVGSVRLWPVAIGGAPAVFLGPIAVEAEMRKHRIGQTLVERACE